MRPTGGSGPPGLGVRAYGTSEPYEITLLQCCGQNTYGRFIGVQVCFFLATWSQEPVNVLYGASCEDDVQAWEHQSRTISQARLYGQKAALL